MNKSWVEIIDHTLIDKLMLVTTDGDIIDEIEGKAIKVEKDGVSFKFWRKRHCDINTKITTEYIGFIVNSKQLKEKYFDGINPSNIKDIVREINNLNVIKISEAALLNSRIGDIDICFDFPATPEAFSKMIKRFVI